MIDFGSAIPMTISDRFHTVYRGTYPSPQLCINRGIHKSEEEELFALGHLLNELLFRPYIYLDHVREEMLMEHRQELEGKEDFRDLLTDLDRLMNIDPLARGKISELHTLKSLTNVELYTRAVKPLAVEVEVLDSDLKRVYTCNINGEETDEVEDVTFDYKFSLPV